MRAVGLDPEKWWADLPALGRSFVHEMALVLGTVRPGEVLQLARRGMAFEPRVRRAGPPPPAPARKPTPEEWWAKLCPGYRESVVMVMGCLGLLRDGQVLQITNSGGDYEAVALEGEKRTGLAPVGGRAELN